MKPTSLETSSAPLLSRCISMPVDISGLGQQVELGEAIKYHLFTYFCLQWVFVAVQGGYSSLWCTGFSGSGVSYCKAWALECALSSCNLVVTQRHVGSTWTRNSTLHWQEDS